MLRNIAFALLLGAFCLGAPQAVMALDHGDPPAVQNLPASNIGDFYAFRAPDDPSQLVVVITFDPFHPPGTMSVPFSDDVKYFIHIDASDDDEIRRRIRIRAREKHGELRIDSDVDLSASFAGLRDDPFLGTPPGIPAFNINALVVQFPIDEVYEGHPIRLWSSTKTSGLSGSFQDTAAFPGRQFAAEAVDPDLDLDELNRTRPRDQQEEFPQLGALMPDVLIIDPTLPAALPNQRGLDDARGFGGLPNNVPFLDEFPFLAPPN